MTQPVPVLSALALLLTFSVPSFSESIPELLHRMDLSARSFTSATTDIRVITHTAVVDKDETESGTLIVKRDAPGKVQFLMSIIGANAQSVALRDNIIESEDEFDPAVRPA